MKLILGTMTFSEQVDFVSAGEMMHRFSDAGHTDLDTAHQYNDGKTEQLLGKFLTSNQDIKLELATKVNPWNEEGLKPRQVKLQFGESLERLQKKSVDLLYLHSPDLETPIEDTLNACWEIFQQGGFRRFGLSNFAAWQVAEVVEKCRSRGWMVPTVYQGMYNALTRDVERELFPCLRNYGISFYAYNPLAGGFLTGKHKYFSEQPQIGRFALNETYLPRYWKADYFEVMTAFALACQNHQIAPTEAALRWLMHHSKMSDNQDDGIILGVSKPVHLEQNLSCAEQALPAEIVDVLDAGWETVKTDCFKYFRP